VRPSIKNSMMFRRRAVAYCRVAGISLKFGGLKNAHLSQIVGKHAGLSTKDEIVEFLNAVDIKGRLTLVKRGPRRFVAPTRTMTDEEFFSSRQWKELRYRAFKEHGTKCLLCGHGREDGLAIHIDHIKPRSKFPDLQWDLKNLQVLCEDCNIGKGNWDETDWRVSA
jgi:hypothetical protein